MRQRRDLIVVGTGIAGLAAAISAREAGLDALLITKADRIDDTATNLAQGGIVAAREGDGALALEADIRRAGCGYNSDDAVRLIAEEGPSLAVEFLAGKAGVEFSRDSSGAWDWTEEAAHSARRILHVQDHTGDAIQAALVRYAESIGLPVMLSCTAIDLITNNHHSTDCRELYKEREVLGVYALDNGSGEVHTLLADAVILACGGLGNIYRYTTNPTVATGDGIAMAHRAGADVINAEFVQFHPTALYHKDIRRFLVSESLRGEGARLLTRDGKPFMERYSPLGDLAPRDVVARAIFEEMAADGSAYVLLDLATRYRGEIPIPERFKRIHETCMSGGIDIEREPIPVTPAAHYFCGGVKVDGRGRTSIRRLHAAGETSCTGVHGANRLASTSLLEGLLWGVRSAAGIASSFERVDAARMDAIPDWKPPRRPESFEPTLIYQDWNLIKLTMWNHAGIVRTRKGLERAVADLDYHGHRIGAFYREATLTRDIIELRNGVASARIVVSAAMHDERSIGCHFRRDPVA